MSSNYSIFEAGEQVSLATATSPGTSGNNNRAHIILFMCLQSHYRTTCNILWRERQESQFELVVSPSEASCVKSSELVSSGMKETFYLVQVKWFWICCDEVIHLHYVDLKQDFHWRSSKNLLGSGVCTNVPLVLNSPFTCSAPSTRCPAGPHRSCEDGDLSLPPVHISSFGLPTEGDTFQQIPLSDPLLSPTITDPPLAPFVPLLCLLWVQGSHAGVEQSPSSVEGEKVPETELLIQSGEQHAQLSIHKGPGWVQGPCRGQAALSPGGINCGWQCVNTGVNSAAQVRDTRVQTQ